MEWPPSSLECIENDPNPTSGGNGFALILVNAKATLP